MFLTEQEIIDNLMLYVLTETSKQLIRSASERDLPKVYSALQGWVIDRYQLADVNNPFVDFSNPANGHDAVARRVIKTVWSLLR